MTRIRNFWSRLRRDRRGIASVEYALLLAVIGGGIIFAANELSTAISGEMRDAAKCIDGTDVKCAKD